MFNVILFQPEIPPNTGNVIRLCANTGAQLHLIRPLGFELDDKQLRRAGLDYHEYASMRVYDDLDACLRSLPQVCDARLPHPNGHGNSATPKNETRDARFPLSKSPSLRSPPAHAGERANESLREFHVNGHGMDFSHEDETCRDRFPLPNPPPLGEGENESLRELVSTRRLFAFTTKGSQPYCETAFKPGDAFLFGPESRGLPASILDSLPSEQKLRLPMLPNNRSLNLSNTVAIAVYEAWRQCGFQM
jgi:tRNA(Leu) C34 or U34 (ribose-2'-O)-methylase TrmL